MSKQSSTAGPILVTGAAGAVGSVGRNVTAMLLAKANLQIIMKAGQFHKRPN